MSAEHYCDLHEWKTIATVTTDNGLLSIVAPYSANTLGRKWAELLSLPPEEFRTWHNEHRNFAELDLEQVTTKHDGTSYPDRGDALLVACENGAYDVQARFCDLYGTGHLSICELRINLHWAEHQEDDEAEP